MSDLSCITKEIKIVEDTLKSSEIKLDDLRERFLKHPAIKSTTRLEQMCEKYGVGIVWFPKYHCELNPIEGFWCYLKNFVRRNYHRLCYYWLFAPTASPHFE